MQEIIKLIVDSKGNFEVAMPIDSPVTKTERDMFIEAVQPIIDRLRKQYQ